MRVTDQMIFDSAASSAGSARDRLQSATNEVSTGQRVVHPGDDPVAAGLLVAHRVSESRYETLVTVTGRASDELSAADTALGGYSDLLSRARELAVQFANSTYSEPQRAAAANEVFSLSQQALALLNTRMDNRYIFGGNLDSVPPFDPTGTYVGDTSVRQVEMAPGVFQNSSIRADVMAKGVGGGADALAALASLGAALASNDIDGIRATFDRLDGSIRQAATGRAQVGASMAVFDSANLAARTARDAETESASHEVDADTISAASRLALAQRALDASLTASAQSFSLTLLDKLK